MAFAEKIFERLDTGGRHERGILESRRDEKREEGDRTGKTNKEKS